MAKKETKTNFIIQQSDIDKAMAYHINKGTTDHLALRDNLNNEEFYSYCFNTIKYRVRPYDGFRKILDAVIDSLYCEKPIIVIKTVDKITNETTYRNALNNGIR